MRHARAARIALALVVSPLLVIAGLAYDAQARRAQKATETDAIDRLARRLPTSDLALSGGARWLRSISLEEPGAAFADGPALPDPDPAGAAMAPPIELWVASSPPSRPASARASTPLPPASASASPSPAGAR